MSTFADLGLPEALTGALRARGITEPFPIQTAALPDALAGRDICGKAPTGSGKTLAFGLTVLAGLAQHSSFAKPGRPLALILLPTRELAAQVTEVLIPLATAVDVKVTAVYGGVGYHPQKTALRRGVEILVGCPGRLEDLIVQGDLDLSDVRWLVLDEADRMADMGFLPAVKRLADQVGPDRQVLLFSATLDGDVDVVVKRYLEDPAYHQIATEDTNNGDVVHLWWRTTRDERTNLTAELVRSHAPAIVFCRTRHGADRLTRRLEAAGVSAAPVHGARSQPQRDKALAAFSSGRVDALIATDVAARGIHVDGVACVIHFDPPADAKDYTHRSGRTGRAGADGVVISLVTDEVRREAKSLQRALAQPLNIVTPDIAGLPSAPPRRPVTPERASRPSRSNPRQGGNRRSGGQNSPRSGGDGYRGNRDQRSNDSGAGRDRTGTAGQPARYASANASGQSSRGRHNGHPGQGPRGAQSPRAGQSAGSGGQRDRAERRPRFS